MSTWAYLTQHLPTSRFLTSSRVCFSRVLAALFHAAATHRVGGTRYPAGTTGVDAFPPHSPSDKPENETTRSPRREQARDLNLTTRMGSSGFPPHPASIPTVARLNVCWKSQGPVSSRGNRIAITRGGREDNHGPDQHIVSHRSGVEV